MNLIFIIEINDCFIFVDFFKICNFCCFLKVVKILKICFEKFVLDSIVFF